MDSHPERVSNIKPSINKCNWKGINYPLQIDNSKMFGKNNPIIALSILCIKEKEKVQLISQKLIQIVKNK